MSLYSVLLIDDSDIDNMVNKRVVEKSGFTSQVVVKSSALSAIDYLKEISSEDQELIPDLIFLDIRMPEIDGFGFLDLYKELSANVHQKATIVMLSSSIDSEDYQKAMSNPFVKDFFNKPLSKESANKIFTTGLSS